MKPIVLPEGYPVALSNQDMEIISESLIVRVKTLRAQFKKGITSDATRAEMRKTEDAAYWLLMHFADLQGISREFIETQLEKNSFMRGTK